MKPSLIVHGGAWDIPDDAVDACKQGCHRALDAGWRILSSGGTALDAVEAAVVILEDDPVFDAGYGSHLNLEGRVECDAIVMDGGSLRAGSAAAVQRVRNPIRLARAIYEHSPHMMLVGRGAERFAKQQRVPACRPEELVSEAEWEAFLKCRKGKHNSAHHRGHELGTVGAVALDQHGNLFAATSTGGTCCKHPGRVGDSPLIGCGCYADVTAGAASCTGLGEAIMKIVMAKSAVDSLRHSSNSSSEPADSSLQNDAQAIASGAAQDATDLLRERGRGTGGIILLDRFGNPAFAFNTPRMAYGYITQAGDLFTSV